MMNELTVLLFSYCCACVLCVVVEISTDEYVRYLVRTVGMTEFSANIVTRISERKERKYYKQILRDFYTLSSTVIIGDMCVIIGDICGIIGEFVES